MRAAAIASRLKFLDFFNQILKRIKEPSMPTAPYFKSLSALFLSAILGACASAPVTQPVERSINDANLSSPSSTYIVIKSKPGSRPEILGYCVIGEESKDSKWRECPSTEKMFLQAKNLHPVVYASAETLEPIFESVMTCSAKDCRDYIHQRYDERASFISILSDVISNNIYPPSSYIATLNKERLREFILFNFKGRSIENEIAADLTYRARADERARKLAQEKIILQKKNEDFAKRYAVEQEQKKIALREKEAQKQRSRAEELKTKNATAHLGKNIPDRQVFCPTKSDLERKTGMISWGYQQTRRQNESYSEWHQRQIDRHRYCAYEQYKYQNETFMQFKVRNGLEQ